MTREEVVFTQRQAVSKEHVVPYPSEQIWLKMHHKPQEHGWLNSEYLWIDHSCLIFCRPIEIQESILRMDGGRNWSLNLLCPASIFSHVSHALIPHSLNGSAVRVLTNRQTYTRRIHRTDFIPLTAETGGKNDKNLPSSFFVGINGLIVSFFMYIAYVV